MKLGNPVDLIIVNRNNQVLLAKRTEKEHGFQDMWSIPGGGSDDNETFEDAVRREIKEELSCEIKWMKYFKSYFVKLENLNVRAVYFYGEIIGEITLNEELSEYQWFDLNEEILNLNLAFNQKKVLKDFIEFRNEEL